MPLLPLFIHPLSGPLKKSLVGFIWIPAFAGMTIVRGHTGPVTPAKAGVQKTTSFFNGLLGSPGV
jgi:hypothetical protein